MITRFQRISIRSTHTHRYATQHHNWNSCTNKRCWHSMIDDRVSLFDTHFSNSPFLYELKVHWKKKKSSVRVFELRCKLKHTTIWQNRDYEIWLLPVLNTIKIWSFHHGEFDTDDSKYIFKGENSLTLEFLVTCGYYLGTLFKGYLWYNYKLMCDTVKIWKFSLDSQIFLTSMLFHCETATELWTKALLKRLQVGISYWCIAITLKMLQKAWY